MIKRILLALSGSPYTEGSIKHAIELAKLHDASITGVTIVNLAELANVGPVPIGGGAAAAALTQHRIESCEQAVQEAIESFESICRGERIPHDVLREEGDPLDLLEHNWRYHDLVVTGLRDLFEYGVVQHPDDMLIRFIKHGIRPLVATAKEYRAVRRALIAYNGSHEAAKAMKQFVQTRPWGDVAVKIVHFHKRKEDPQTLLREAKAYCLAHGIDAETEFINKEPCDQLIKAAHDWNADLIVIGSTGRSRLTGYMLGDTIKTAIRHADVPLYLTR